MASEIGFQWSASVNTYVLIRNSTNQIWNGATFVTYSSGDIASYGVAATQQGTSGYYTATMPSVAAGLYNITAYQRLGGSAAEGDIYIGSQTFMWNGSAPSSLSDAATSGQVGAYLPQRMARGVQVLNFPLYLKSSADHVTPFTSGIVSGQISRDGGAFGPLQSGAFVETGMGFYRTTLTSGDLLANAIALQFAAVGISGGTSDPLPLGMVLQRTSGQTVT